MQAASRGLVTQLARGGHSQSSSPIRGHLWGKSLAELQPKLQKTRILREYYDNSIPLKPVPFRTLDRNLLTPEDYVDLSDVRGIAFDSEVTTAPRRKGEIPYIPYGRRQKFIDGALRLTHHTPFPVNTRGFFYYYHRPLVPVCGAIRFRVVQDPDPSLFNLQGTDLLNEYGTVWQFPLLAIVGEKRYDVLRDVLLRLRPGLHVAESLKRVAALKTPTSSSRSGTTRFGPLSQIVYESGEPFYLSLASHDEAVFFAGDDRIYKLYARNFLHAHYGSEWPYESGIIKCRIEMLTSDFGVRVLRIIEPLRMKAHIQRAAPFVADTPRVGYLLTRNGVPKRFFQTKEEGKTAAVRETLLRRYNAVRQAQYQRLSLRV